MAGWVAIALGIVTVATIVCIVLLYTVGQPFGTLNDAGNALIGIGSAVLAVLLVREAGGWPGVAAAIAAAVVATWGSWLVMTGTTGFVLAGFVSTVGFGLVGVWLASVAWAPAAEVGFGGLLVVARITAVAMIVGGIIGLAAALMRIDSYTGMPGWVWAFSIGWIGVYVLYPVVLVGLGRRLLDS